MKKYALFIAGFLVFNPLAFAELTKAQLWAVSLSGIMTETNRSNRNTLNTKSMSYLSIDKCLTTLSRDWDINTREELFEVLEGMEYGGHSASLGEIQGIVNEISKAGSNTDTSAILSKYELDQTKYNRLVYVSNNWDRYNNRTIKAWDLGRGISLCRWGYNAGLINEKEAWYEIFQLAYLIQPLYDSWEEYGYDYLMGGLFWASGFGEEDNYLSQTEPVFRQLLDSYWNWLDWHIDLDEDETSLPFITIDYCRPNDNDGKLQFLTNDPVFYDKRWVYRFSNSNPDPNVYEYRIKKISGANNSIYGIVFCQNTAALLSPNTGCYYFYITVTGRFMIYKYNSNPASSTRIIDWRDSPYLYTGYNVCNTLRVERTDNENGAAFRIFINGHFIESFFDDTPLNGNKAGLIVYVNSRQMEQFPHIPVDVRFDY